MKNVILFTLTILLISCQPTSKKNVIPNKTKNHLLNQTQIDSLNEKLDSLNNIGIYNGFSVSIVDTSGIVFNRGVGYSDVSGKVKYNENTIQNIASISKVFIGVSLLKAQELGLLKLDDAVNKYLDFEVKNPHFPEVPITIRHLATHTSSILDTDEYMENCYVNKYDIPLKKELKEDYDIFYKNSSATQISLSNFLNNILNENGKWHSDSTYSKIKPGGFYEYSNVGASLCALIIENASKQPFSKFTEEYIFKPLKMSSTGWFFKDVDMTNHTKLYIDESELPYYESNSYPDGALITSNVDLSNFLVELVRGHAGKGRLLSKSSYNEFFKSQLQKEQFEKNNFNVGLFLDKELQYHDIGHNGGDPGTNTLMYLNSKNNTGRIMILNSDSDKENSWDVYWGIWGSLDVEKYK